MIHIVDDFYVDVDELNYTVCRKSTGIRNGIEVDVYKPCGYYGTLRGAVKGVVEKNRRKMLAEKEVELVEAIKILKEADDMVENLLYRALSEKK